MSGDGSPGEAYASIEIRTLEEAIEQARAEAYAAGYEAGQEAMREKAADVCERLAPSATRVFRAIRVIAIEGTTAVE
ncbi:hypothetical protein LMIY3S_04775 [Labrys miyagiensis]